MAKLRKFNEIVRDFATECDFLTVYIEEAHPADGWCFSNNYDVSQHVKLADRIKAASYLLKAGIDCPVVLDNMQNDACAWYGGLYERLYIVLDGAIVYQGERGPMGYHVEEVESWLIKYFAK
ncbi:hypothetical protein SNE40_011779 [Patella caerulea]|uniref:Iodothyronine deiodinase n=1 Tax=Patella caerulea TaxID=87958 RepID=A0AAN8PPR8_PATCE